MIQYIPWTSHSATIPVFLLIYYVLLILLCFSGHVVDLFRKTSHPNHKLASEDDVENSQHQAAINEISAYMGQASYYILAKADLTSGLMRLLSKYKNLQNTSYETSINQLILEECECCNVRLSKEEVDQLWVV